MRTALVTCGGGLQGLAVIAALRQVPQLRVIVMDNTEDNLGRYCSERFILAPPISDEPAFLDAVERACREHSVDLVLPSTEYELGTLARNASFIRSTGARLLSSPQAVLAVATDKLELHRWLESNDLPSLPTSCDPRASGLLPPLLGKPRRGWGAKAQRLLLTAQDVEAAATPDPQVVWQPRLSGFSEYSVDFAIDEAGRISPLAIRRRSRTLSGFALMGDFVVDVELKSLVTRVTAEVARLGGLGLYNLQVLCQGQDRWVTDLNPRAGTSLPLSLAAGFNPVAFLLGERGASPNPGQRSFRLMRERVVPQVDAQAVEGLVFDLDDTLLDQKDWIARKLEVVWKLRQDRLPTRSEFLKAGYTALEEGHRADLLNAVCRQLDLDEAACIDLIEVYRRAVPDGCRLYNDVLPVLAELRSRGFRLGLLTDNPAVSQRMKIDVAGLSEYFDGIVLTGELGQRKPATLCFETAARSLELESQSLAMVGDHLYRDGLGALDADYALAFHIHRPGGMFDFSTPRLSAEFHDGRVVHIDSLTELFWHLPELSSSVPA